LTPENVRNEVVVRRRDLGRKLEDRIQETGEHVEGYA
jgi:hypothetical protein